MCSRHFEREALESKTTKATTPYYHSYEFLTARAASRHNFFSPRLPYERLVIECNSSTINTVTVGRPVAGCLGFHHAFHHGKTLLGSFHATGSFDQVACSQMYTHPNCPSDGSRYEWPVTARCAGRIGVHYSSVGTNHICV